MTNVFFDTEFTGLHKDTTLISIGLISECGREFYAELTDYDNKQLDDWLQKHVIDNLFMREDTILTLVQKHDDYHKARVMGNTQLVAARLKDWLSQFDNVQMISDCLSYDWVLFCHIWGHAFNIPENVSPAPRDINQDMADHLTISERSAFDVSREKFAGLENDLTSKHNAMWDAIVIKACWERLKNAPNKSD